MNADMVTKAVHEVLAHIQSSHNFKCPKLVDTLKPIKDLENFTSPISLMATGMLGRKLGLKIQPEINVFGDKNGLFTIKKTIDLLCKIGDEQAKKETAKT
jgi:hypothetical protein